MVRARIARRCALLVLLAAVLVTALAASFTRPPRWYAPPAPDDARVKAQAADFEYDIAVELQRIREADALWELDLQESDVNAWLAARLPDWWVQQGHGDWPRDLRVPQVRLYPEGRFEIVLPVGPRSASAMAHATGSLTLDERGLHVTIDGTRLGLTPLPRAVTVRAAGLAGEAWTALVGQGLAVEPVITLADRRRVRAIDLQTDEGRLTWRLQTELRAAAVP